MNVQIIYKAVESDTVTVIDWFRYRYRGNTLTLLPLPRDYRRIRHRYRGNYRRGNYRGYRDINPVSPVIIILSLSNNLDQF